MAASAENRPARRWLYLAVVTGAQVGVSILHLGIPALIPLIQEDFALSRAQVGLTSSVLNGVVVVAAIAAGKLVDRFGERWLIAAGPLLAGGAALASPAVAGYGGFLVLLALIGLATATCTPAGSKAVAGWFPARERGTAMSVRQTSVPLGGAIAALTMPRIGLAYGWRWSLVAAGLFALACAAAASLAYRSPPRLDPRTERGERAGVRDILRRRELRAAYAYGLVLSGGQWCFLTYLELYLTESLWMPLALAAVLLAVGQAAGTAARVLWGVVSDRLFRGRRIPVLVLIGFLAIAATSLVSILSPRAPTWLAVLLVALMGATLMGWNGVYVVAAAELAGLRVAGLAIGLSGTFAFLGIVILPPVFGYLIDRGLPYWAVWNLLSLSLLPPLYLLREVEEGK